MSNLVPNKERITREKGPVLIRFSTPFFKTYTLRITGLTVYLYLQEIEITEV